MNFLLWLALPWLTLSLLAAAACADIRPAALFSDRVVLQRDKPVPVWGTAAAGDKITVTFGSQKREATAGHDGRWIVILDPLPASKSGCELIIAGQNTITLRDVLVGEVWLCAGQSSPERSAPSEASAADENSAFDPSLIRGVRLERAVAPAPQDTATTLGWHAASPPTADAFTATGFAFVRGLHQKLGIPIGLVQCTWDDLPITSWLSPAALANEPSLRLVHERWERMPHEDADPTRPAAVFNAMINPLLPFALRGVVWFSSVHGATQPAEFSAQFAAMITAWRLHFAQGDLPFYWSALPGCIAVGNEDARGRAVAFLREAQAKTLTLPNTGQAIAIDLGDPRRTQFFNTDEIGRRLALLARNRDYELYGDDTGPTFVHASRDGAGLRVRFTHVSGGLIAHNRPVQSLELAGADRVFHPAEGKIERDTLLVTSAKVREPIAVRYAWTNAPDANLYNGAGLPAVPFRSDDW